MRRTRSVNKMSKASDPLRTPIKEAPAHVLSSANNNSNSNSNNNNDVTQQHSITITESNRPHVHKGLRLFQAIAINVMNMFGTGPFITLPILLEKMDGPPALLGYLLATTLAICDGLVWAELGTSLPEAGGTYSYLLEGFGPKKWGRLMAFLFVWQMIISGPLEIASGYVGVAQYFSYFWRNVTDAPAIYSLLVAAGVGLLNICVIYRDLSDLNKFTAALFAVTLFTIFFVSVTGWVEFNPAIAFEHQMEWKFSSSLLLGVFSAMRVAVYDFTGYFEICYMGSEVENPGRVIPRAVIGSILIVVSLFLSVDFAVIGIVPWRELLPTETGDGPSQYPIAYFLEVAYPSVSTILPNIFVILLALTVYGSSYSMLLGYSRIPYAASADGNFLPYFDRLHPTKGFPYVSVLVTGLVSIAACFIQLDTLITAMITARILVQYIAQIVALTLLRRKNQFPRPFSVWLYPLPNIIAAVLWLALFFSAEIVVIIGTIGTIIIGVVIFIVKAHYRKEWPFLPPQEEIH